MLRLFHFLALNFRDGGRRRTGSYRWRRRISCGLSERFQEFSNAFLVSLLSSGREWRRRSMRRRWWWFVLKGPATRFLDEQTKQANSRHQKKEEKTIEVGSEYVRRLQS